MRTPVMAAWLALLGSLALACGDGATEAGAEVTTGGEAAPAPPPDPLALVPTDAFSVMRVDLATLRRSPYWPTITAWLDDAERAAADAGQPMATLRTMRQALDRMEVVVIATTPPSTPGAEPDPIVIARGSFVEDELRQLVVGSGASAPRESQGQTVHVGPEFAGAQIGDHTWLVAPEPELEALLARYRSGGGPIASDALRGMAERVDLAGAPAAFAMEVLPDQREIMARRLRIPGTDGIENASTLGARLDISSGLGLIALADMPSAAAAEQLAGQVRGTLDGYSSNVMVRMMGVGPVFDATTVTAGGNEVRLATELSADDTAALLDRLGTFIRLALQSAVMEVAARAGPGAAGP